MAKLIDIKCEANPESEHSCGWVAYFEGKPTKKECLDAWKTKNPQEPDGGIYHDMSQMPEDGPTGNLADPRINNYDVWRVWLGCYQ